jgi:WD repeat-containing protein 89
MLGRIENAHVDEITQLYFHPYQANAVVSGSLDGLVCTFDTLNLDEEECLLSTCNVEDSISRIGFFGLRGEYMYCMTGTERFSMWNFLDSERIKTWDDPRSALMEASGGTMKVDYLVDGHFQESEGRLFLFAGSFDGNIVLAEVHRDFLQPLTQLSGGHSAMVRSVAVPDVLMPDRLFTGGEDSRLCSWKFLSSEEIIPKELSQTSSSSVRSCGEEDGEEEERKGDMMVESGRQRRGERRHAPFTKKDSHHQRH